MGQPGIPSIHRWTHHGANFIERSVIERRTRTCASDDRLSHRTDAAGSIEAGRPIIEQSLDVVCSKQLARGLVSLCPDSTPKANIPRQLPPNSAPVLQFSHVGPPVPLAPHDKRHSHCPSPVRIMLGLSPSLTTFFTRLFTSCGSDQSRVRS